MLSAPRTSHVIYCVVLDICDKLFIINFNGWVCLPKIYIKITSLGGKHYFVTAFLYSQHRRLCKYKKMKGEKNMIKVIAFDLVGVLVTEKDILLSNEEDKLERMFGDNLNDADYIIEARKIINKDSIIMKTTENLIDKLYQVKDKDLFKNLKEKYPNIKIIIATNHVSFVRNFIGESFGIDYLDDVLISAEIHKIKPNKDFYDFILKKYNLLPEELLFLDDNIKNINGADVLNIKTIKVDKDTNLFLEIQKIIENNNKI